MGRGSRSSDSSAVARARGGVTGAAGGPLRHTTFPNLARPIDFFSQRARRDGEQVFDLTPPYQRGQVWAPEQQVNLIRSVLEGVPIGGIFLNDRGDFVYRVVDGLQRVTAISDYLADRVKLPRAWFADEELAETARDQQTVVFSDLSVPRQRRFGFNPLLSYETSFPSEADEAALFDLINTSGVAHGAEAKREADAAHMVSDRPLSPVKLSPYNFTIMHFIEDRAGGEPKFDLDAPYQRALVWDDERRVNLVRSLLLGIPQGAITLNDRGDFGPMVVIDGKQRISAYRSFWNSEFAVPRAWFEDRYLAADALAKTDVTFRDLSQTGQTKLGMSSLPAYQSQFATEAEEHEVFNRLNFSARSSQGATAGA